MNLKVRRLETAYSTLVWSDGGSVVTKSRSSSPDARRRFVNELRVNQMLRNRRPPVPTPRLVGHDRHSLSLSFEAIDGEPLGPKYPLHLGVEDIDAVVALGQRLGTYRPRRRWFRWLRSAQRLDQARRAGLLSDDQTAKLTELANRHHRRLTFAHGDMTARNVMRHDNGLSLIDWEWAGLYPPGYELAFLWFSLAEMDDGRALVEQRSAVDEKAFLLSALLIQLWHLQWYVPQNYRDKHLSTRDLLIARLTDR